MKIYTKTGDQGETCLYDGSRTTKDDLRMETVGAMDELGSHLGLIYSAVNNEQQKFILAIIHTLFKINAHIAGSPAHQELDLNQQIKRLENHIDEMTAPLKPLTNFIYPVGNSLIANIHIARAICRRAERQLIAANREFNYSPTSKMYLNRLSDWLFTLSRFIAFSAGIDEIAIVNKEID
jgi:cob(I)alamin adenosyltransferase